MPKLPVPFTRRRLLLGGAIAAADLSLAGCHPYPLRIATPPPPSVMNSPLTIDVHCHIFNGTDLPVREFLTERVWARVPAGEAEWHNLGRKPPERVHPIPAASDKFVGIANELTLRQDSSLA